MCLKKRTYVRWAFHLCALAKTHTCVGHHTYVRSPRTDKYRSKEAISASTTSR